jgi:hypothetical protein
VVHKVEVAPETPEDELAVSLLNAVAAIRQLAVEGMTRELRVFGRLRVSVVESGQRRGVLA